MTLKAARWQGENDFALFKASMPVSSKRIWQAFYQLHQEKISIQNEKIATGKLKVIITSTFKLSKKRGFALMSLRDLSHETQISMGSLYTYIGSKSQLAEMIHQFLPHMVFLVVGNLNDDSLPCREQLFKLIRGHVFISECLQAWFFFAFMETKNLDYLTREYAKNNEKLTENLLKDILDRGRLNREFAIDDSFLMSMAMKSLLQSWYLKHVKYRRAKLTCETYISFIERLIAPQLECQ